MQDFVEAFCAAERGTALPYFRGSLAMAREEARDARKSIGWEAANALDNAAAAWRLYEDGKAHLVQRREADGTLTYLAVRR